MEVVELIGKMIIQENIDTVDENKIPKTFVINVPDPYKSYYNRFSDFVSKPNSVIFVTKEPNSFERILRSTRKINKRYNMDLNGGKCEIAIADRKLNGIRVRGIQSYSEIEKIQEYYRADGFEFSKSEKFKNTDSLIRVNRFFCISKMAEGIFRSNTEDDVFYVEVPKLMTWEEFRTYTFEVKNNISDRNYDIAKGIFYINGGIMEMMRIVKPNISIDLLRTIQQKYIEKLQ